MAVKPNHPLFKEILLKIYINSSELIHNSMVLDSTGPFFLTNVVKDYLNLKNGTVTITQSNNLFPLSIDECELLINKDTSIVKKIRKINFI